MLMMSRTAGILAKKHVLRILFSTLFVLLIAIPFAPCANAQADLGSLTGTVTDGSGLVIPNAAIQMKNADSGVVRTGVSSANGAYTIPSLVPGKYEIKVTAPGFNVVNSTVTITLGGTSAFNVSMPVGSVSQQVVVESGNATELHTESHEISQVIGEQQLTQLPSNGRNLLDLAVLGPGAQSGTDYNGSMFQGSGAFFSTLQNSVMIGGLQNIHTSFLQDGVDNVNLMTQSANIVSSVEAAQEVTTLLSGAPARYAQPSVVNVITRNGGNAFHGVAYDFLQNEDLNARDYFATSRPAQRYNLFGANLGGPILHKKLFFFFDYSGLRNHAPSVATGIVPTNAERACFTSSAAFCDFTGSGFTLYDPASYSPTGTSATFLSEYGVNGIPANRLDPFAKLWINLYPTSNVPTEANGTNYVTNVQNSTTYDQYDGRVDYTISARQQIFGTYTRNVGYQKDGSIVPGLFGPEFPNHSTNASIEHTFVLSSNLVNTARIGYNRSAYYISQEGVGSANFAAQYGIANLDAAPAEWAPPTVGITNITSFGTPYTPQGNVENRFQYADEVTYTRGRHTLVAGVQVIRTQFQGLWAVNDNGQFSYDGTFTSEYMNGVRSTTQNGSPLADFFLGFPFNSQGSIGNGLANFREFNVVGYVQDDWKVSPTFVLNLGVRYSFDNPPNALDGKSFIFNLATATATPGTWRTNYNDWAPRIGFSWSPDRKTTVTGGYGIYYTSFPYNDLQFLVLLPPNHVNQSQNYTVANPTHIQNSLLPASQVSLAQTASTAFSSRAKDASVDEYNLGIEHSITNNLIASIAYAGNLSRHTGVWSYPNQPTGPAPGSITNQFTVVPYPNLGMVNQWTNEANANYNALLAKLTGSGNGFHGTVSYTFSKAMDLIDGDGNVYEVYNHPEYNYAVAGWDRPHQLTVSGTYDIPLTRKSGLMQEALGGWQVGAIYRLASGEPVTVSATDETDYPAGYPMLANRVCDPSSGFTRSRAEWFNTACFAQPAVGTYGRGGRDAVRSPRENQLNLSVDKSFALYREHQLQFRVEAFNALNHPELLLTAASITQPGFGALNAAEPARVLQVGLRYSF